MSKFDLANELINVDRYRNIDGTYAIDWSEPGDEEPAVAIYANRSDAIAALVIYSEVEWE
jgi:hypothetical protein